MVNITRIPTESWNLVGLAGDGYGDFKVGPTCSVPGCNRLASDAHHLVRRSFLGGPFNWVRMDDGVEIGNISALCFAHHQAVTEALDTITYDKGVFYWSNGEPLSQQPPTILDGEVSTIAIQHAVEEGHVRQKCPTCLRVMPKEKIDTPTEEKKNRQTWAISIPVTEQENGYMVLDELLEAAREKLDDAGVSYSTARTARYHVLTATLGIFVQNADLVLGDS